MNDDIKVLAMLLRYSQRRMVSVIGQVESCLDGDAGTAQAVVTRLGEQGLVYVEGVSVRLTFPGFACAVAATATLKNATVHRLGRRRASSRSHAA
jgi:predicted transcriptional regulator